MKVSIKQLALFLYEITSGKHKEEVDRNISSYFKMLSERRMISRVEQIIKRYIEIYNKSHGIVEAKVYSVFDLNSQVQNILRKKIQEETGSKKVKLDIKINRELVGGVRVEFDGYVIDTSIDSKLKKLRQEMQRV